MVRFSHDVLDSFTANELSELLAPTMPEVPEEANQSIVFTLNYAVGGVKFKRPAVVQVITSAMHHNASAVRSYRSARERMQEYIAELPNHDKLFAIVQALDEFENCILHTHITALCLSGFQKAMTGEGFLPPKDPKNEYARLRLISNRIKHFDEDIDVFISKNQQAPARAIWLTDAGIVCETASLSYSELKDILTAHSDFVRQLASSFFADPAKHPLIKLV